MPAVAGNEGMPFASCEPSCPVECCVTGSHLVPENAPFLASDVSTSSMSAAESVPITAGDLDVGGAYKIPRKKWR
jgi:hypothetical protein